MKNSLEGKHLVLGVTGGIAAYKSVELLRLFQKAGASVKVVMTKNATWFVAPLTFEAISGEGVFSDMFAGGSETKMRHISWADEADAVVVAPATANILGKLACGIADDALTTLMLAATCRKIVCPSMNTHMYESRPVQRNLDVLKADGYVIVEPDEGELACGAHGPGRMAEPEAILERVALCFYAKDFAGRKVLVTAGPTREPMDPVRFISNPSSGKMGYAVARAAAARGAAVVLVSGPTLLSDPRGVRVIRVQTAAEMADAVFKEAKASDLIIKVAAVSDYRPRTAASQKIKKQADELVVPMEKTEDILAELGRRKRPGQVLVGFAAETEALKKNAVKKLKEKNLDLIAANLVNDPSSGFGTDTSRISLFYSNGKAEELAMMDKDAAAHALLDRVLNLPAGRH